jgi:hypothetical protein
MSLPLVCSEQREGVKDVSKQIAALSGNDSPHGSLAFFQIRKHCESTGFVVTKV